MRLLIFSDIHGNIAALDCLQRIESIEDYDAVAYCGDSIGYFPDGEAVIERLREIPGLIAVKGNHDDNLVRSQLGQMDSRELADRYGSGYLRRYSKDALEYLQSLPENVDITLDGLRFGIVHGTLADPLLGRLYPDGELPSPEECQSFDVVICGHTHYRMLERQGKTIILNPGSLGQPRDGKGFSYCVFDTDAKEASFKNIIIDDDSIARMLASEPNGDVVSYLERKQDL